MCYLRLDFESFTLQGVGGTDIVDEGVCTDMFIVTVSTMHYYPHLLAQSKFQHFIFRHLLHRQFQLFVVLTQATTVMKMSIL